MKNKIIPFNPQPQEDKHPAPEPQEDNRLAWVAIGACVLVSFVALGILVYLGVNAPRWFAPIPEVTTEPATTLATEPATESVTESTTELVTEPTTEVVTEPATEPTAQQTTELATEPATETATEPVTEPHTEAVTEPVRAPAESVYEINDNLSAWFLENDSKAPITIWKKSDEEGFMISLRNEEDVTLVTFLYGDEVLQGEWTAVDTTTTQEIIDIVFVAYREVSGNNPENVQAQVGVLQNREESKNYPNSIRKIITAPTQYSCKNSVLNRKLKSSKRLEKQDLEKCFREVLKVLANEGSLDVPDNVVFAAPFKQGKGVWKKIDGTYYCYE